MAPGTSPAEAALVRSYELSLTAQSEAEYSQIIRDCASASRSLKGDNLKFCHELSAWALNRRGQARVDQGQFDLALADFRAALEFDPNCWRAYHNRGVSLAQAGKFAEAFDDVCRVIAINPKFAKAYANRATLYVQAGDVERAISDYQEALRLEPKLTQALVGFGRLCHMTGRLDEALTNFDRAMGQPSDVTAEVACSRGDLLVDLGRYRDALRDYATAIDLDPQFEHAYRNGAWLLATCPDGTVRDAQAALVGAKKALACGYGDRCAALDTLAAAQANAGQYQQAVATIEQAIQIAPEEARPVYEERRQMYKSGLPFRTEPVSDVQTADFVEG
jgi:tetratricopeptide (TPR) repeat protein